MHKSDQITRKGLERIKEYCKSNESCQECKISLICKEIETLYPVQLYPEYLTYQDITTILKATRNYMEATFIESLEKIVEQGGDCGCIECDDCPFLHTDTQIDCHNDNCSRTSLHKVKTARLTERKEIAEWLLEIYKGEAE